MSLVAIQLIQFLRTLTLWPIILGWMNQLSPSAPWKDTYLDTSYAIASVVSEEEPFYKDDETRIRTAATLVALASYESAFDTTAWGDRGKGDSYGLYQQQRFGRLSDPREATRVAFSQIRISMRICRGKPKTEMLGWYAAGGDGCDNERGRAKSRERMKRAMKLAEGY